MLYQKINNEGLVFSVNIDGNNIDFNEWSETNERIYYIPLVNLVNNGYARLTKYECIVPFENIYYLDEEEKQILDIPETYNKAMRLRSINTLNMPEFQYTLDFLTHVPDGDLLLFQRNENIITCGTSKYLLSEKQFELINKVEAFNKKEKSEKTIDFNLRSFGEIKTLAQKANCKLDNYLANENVHIPEIKINIEKDSTGGCIIEPGINNSNNEELNQKFKEKFKEMIEVKSQYTIVGKNGELTRIPIDKKQKENLDKIKIFKYKPRKEKEKIIEHPTEYFDPEVIDLSEFYSDRVIEIGIYKPKFYPFICPYKSCWIAGATIKTPENGTTKITIKSEEELEDLKTSIQEAKEQKRNIVNHSNIQLNIDDAIFLFKIAEKQLKRPDKVIQINNYSEREERKVLIIEENAENTGYTLKQRNIENKGKYTLFKNPYLNQSFSLKNHQEEGIAWLQYLYKNKASGCLMADDMGLGKTLQILYFIDWHYRKHTNYKPYLIVAPVSLLENWENEYDKFFSLPKLSINKLTSKEVPRQFNKEVIATMQKMDIILTNYESLRISQLNFCAVEFDIVVLDEAQKIKSPGTLITNAAKALKSNFKIAMTGTPVENTLLDLWCIMDFCVPGLLGNAKEFAAKYQNPLKKEDTDIVALGEEVHKQLGIYFMRRLKKDVAKDLPEKHELKQQIQMPPLQENIYHDVINNYLSSKQSNMLVTIMKIREISEHPYLYNSTLSEHDFDELITTSAKLQATITFLDKIKSKNEKVILFAERKEIQKMLQKICYERYGVVYKIINGDTPSIISRQTNNKLSRQASIDDFQSINGFNIIIMSPVAAGMGLNVTAANHVIHYSRHWNPAKENQATDRAYRIGQTKDVYIYYPMAVSKNFKSFDETLDELLSRKTNLATSTIFPTERIEVKQEELGEMLFGLQ